MNIFMISCILYNVEGISVNMKNKKEKNKTFEIIFKKVLTERK